VRLRILENIESITIEYGYKTITRRNMRWNLPELHWKWSLH